MEEPYFITSYARWHYTRAYRDAYEIWMTFLWFITRFFAFNLHLRTLFSRFHRLGDQYGGDVGGFVGTLIVNGFMRLIGFVLRSVVLAVGFLMLTAVFFGGVTFFIVWTLYPLVILAFGVFSIIAFTLAL